MQLTNTGWFAQQKLDLESFHSKTNVYSYTNKPIEGLGKNAKPGNGALP